MLLKAIGQLLGTDKGYRTAVGKCPKVIEHDVGNFERILEIRRDLPK
jgi:hypothetical protein